MLRVPQGLDYKRLKIFNLDNVAKFYANQELLYLQHNYLAKCIWTLDESGCQTSKNGLDKVFAKREIRRVH